MAWGDYETPTGAGQLQLYVQFKGGNAIGGVIVVNSSENPTDEQYQAVVDALAGSDLVQSATLTETNPVGRTMTTDLTPPGDS